MRVISSFIYGSLLVSLAAGCVTDPADPNDPGGGGSGGFHAIKMPAGKENLNFSGVYCASATQCVATANLSGIGGVYALGDTDLGELLVDGTYPGPVPTAADQLGDVNFVGIDKSRSGVIARAGTSGAFVSATGDITKKASWSVASMGKADGASLPLNDQAQLVDTAGKWLFLNELGFVYSSPTAPGPSTVWTKLWSPQATPSVPANFPSMYSADPTLCDSDLTGGAVPFISNPAFISPDGAVIVHPAGGISQKGTAKPGVCISTDKGAHFYSAPFADVADVDNAGPHGVTCTDNNHCVALHGLDFVGDPYIYTTANATMGKASTWTKATLPASVTGASNVSLRAVFFAPDGKHGWCVGDISHDPLLLKTVDGGKTWTDSSASVASVATRELNNGFALDADHIWLVGNKGTVVATATAQK
ncbi:MAG TPA: hypothetical protein PLF40_14085 [Kofleriaceae bacterium]|nr:hypothetical protein [Kofleriaceae bacterium]